MPIRRLLPLHVFDEVVQLVEALRPQLAAYTLAGSTDPANFVAETALSACSANLTSWNQAALGTDATGANGGAAVQAPSLVTGQETNPIAEHYAYAQSRALFYVVQARAGHCGAPPQTVNDPNQRS